MTSTRTTIAAAVDNDVWQAFRVKMKGKSTQEKIDMLQQYFKAHVALAIEGEDVYDFVCIRVDNYIKALCRGGQLYAGESLETALENDWNLKIKK